MSSNHQVLLDKVIEQRKIEYNSNVNDSDFFEFFVCSEILKNEDLSFDEVEDGITDGSRDGGIDAFFLFVDGRLIIDEEDISIQRNSIFKLYIIQATRRDTFKEDAVIKMENSLKEILDFTKDSTILSQSYNQNLVDKVMVFQSLYKKYASKFPKLEIKIYYVTRSISSPHGNVDAKSNALSAAIKTMFSDACTVDFEFLGATELWNLASKEPTRTIKMIIAGSSITTTKKDTVCFVSLEEYFKFITDEDKVLRKNIFESNVRDFQGNVEVNQNIENTLKNYDGKENFWWLNNGITIICSNFKLTGNELTIEEPQIVNGLQTTNQIYNYFIALKEDQVNSDFPKRHILLRLIQPESERGRDKIIKATNSQTAILPGQLHATDPIQREIEKYFESTEICYDRRKNYYKNQGRHRDSIISISGLAQAVNAILLQKPHLSRAKPASLIKDDKRYKEIFNQKSNLKLYLSIARMMMKIEKFMKKEEAKNFSRDLKYHLAMYAVAKKIGKLNPTEQDLENNENLQLEDGYLLACLKNVDKTIQEFAIKEKSLINKIIKAGQSTEIINELLKSEF